MKGRLAAKFVLVALVASAWVVSVKAQIGPGSERVVSARGYASVDAVRPGDKFKVAVVLEIEEGYHINAHLPSDPDLVGTKLAFQSARGLKVGELRYPAPIYRSFEFSPDQQLAVHEGLVIITAEVEADRSLPIGTASIQGTVEVQSCNDTQCLRPADLPVEIPVSVIAPGSPVKELNADIFARAAATPAAGAEPVQVGGAIQQKDSIADRIASQGLVLTLLFVFVSGLALNTTPCVYPIIPITIGFFANQGGGGAAPRFRRTFAMAATYVFGMAITYSVLGVVASLTKGLFGAALQNKFVLIGLASLMVALALSMFGVYEFRLPQFLNRFATRSTQSASGLLAALVMGLTMGIVAAPCIGPFVLALLVHVGTKGDAIYGFFMFFVLALGLGAPYLVLGTFSGALKSLPRSGEWMVTVRKVFGLVLVGMALYFLMPLLGDSTSTAFIVFFALSALYLIFWESGRAKARKFAWMLRSVGLGAAAIAIMMAVPGKTETEAVGITWEPYSEAKLAAARKEGKPVIIDAFADWCIPCKELDRFTFTNESVRKEAEEKFVRLKVDLTRKENPESENYRAQQQFGIWGAPTVLFLDSSGREMSDLRLVEFEKPDPFLQRLKKASASSSPASALSEDAGKPLPDVTIKLLNGKSVDLRSLRGKIVLLDFWATWCLPCLAEIPTFNAIHKEYKGRGVEIIAVALDEEGAEVVKPFLKKHRMDYTIAIGDLKLAEMFGVTDSIPVTLVVDKQGLIRFTHIGVTEKSEFEAQIKQLLQEP